MALKDAPFTMENSLKIKQHHRQTMKSLSIDEKIKRVESLRERLKTIKKFKQSAHRTLKV